MREILFRGKRLDHGNWEEGYYSPKDLPAYDAEPVDMPCIIRESDLLWCKVDPATVGQYTGLQDKNGKRIFEGDIVRMVSIANDHHQKGTITILCVRYWMGNPCLCFAGHDSGTPIYPCCVSATMEVIGNIHDNPELIGGGEA